jgi:hypothetical protein
MILFVLLIYGMRFFFFRDLFVCCETFYDIVCVLLIYGMGWEKFIIFHSLLCTACREKCNLVYDSVIYELIFLPHLYLELTI